MHGLVDCHAACICEGKLWVSCPDQLWKYAQLLALLQVTDLTCTSPKPAALHNCICAPIILTISAELFGVRAYDIFRRQSHA